MSEETSEAVIARLQAMRSKLEAIQSEAYDLASDLYDDSEVASELISAAGAVVEFAVSQFVQAMNAVVRKTKAEARVAELRIRPPSP